MKVLLSQCKNREYLSSNQVEHTWSNQVSPQKRFTEIPRCKNQGHHWMDFVHFSHFSSTNAIIKFSRVPSIQHTSLKWLHVHLHAYLLIACMPSVFCTLARLLICTLARMLKTVCHPRSQLPSTCSRQRIHCESYYMAATLFQCTMVCSWELGPQKGSSSHKHISLNWTILGHVPLSILLIYSNIYHQRMTRETNKKIHLHTCSHSPTTHTHRSPCPYTQMLVWRYEGETSWTYIEREGVGRRKRNSKR